MKKIVSIFAAAVLAVGFMGCSNDSDDNSALMLALASQSSGGTYLPASVGENNLSGNTYKAGNDTRNVTYEFSSNSFTVTSNTKVDAVASVNSAYTLKNVITYSYSYDSVEGIIFTNNSSEKTYVVRGTVETPYELASFSNDAQFIAAEKAYIKLTNDLMSDADLEAAAKALRYSTYGNKPAIVDAGNFIAYTDTTSTAEVPEQIIKTYNETNALYKAYHDKAVGYVTPYAYEVTSSSLKVSSSSVYPKDTTLADLYSKKFNFTEKYDSNNYLILNNAHNQNLGTFFDSYSGIEAGSTLSDLFMISGISSDTISLKKFSIDYTSGNAKIESADPWSYTETEVTEGLKVTLSEGSAEKGNFVIPYKTSSTSYATYEKQ
ncbi:MAG: hypothetical protein UHO11_10735 [Treponema sp.]|nr:hypothetical protein [Treponema sp.]